MPLNELPGRACKGCQGMVASLSHYADLEDALVAMLSGSCGCTALELACKSKNAGQGRDSQKLWKDL